MVQLLKIEWLKLRKLNAFFIILCFFIVLLPTWMFALNFMFSQWNKVLHIFPDSKDFWSFPTVWRFVTYSASWFTFLFSIVIIIITTQEFENKTLRQHVIDGLSKRQVIVSKLLVIVILTTIMAAIVFITTLSFGASQGEVNLYEKIHYFVQYIVQSFCYLGLAFVIAMLIKKPALSILIYLGIQFVEFMVGNFLPEKVYEFFPMNCISKLTPNPIIEGLTQRTAEKNHMDTPFMSENWQNVLVAGITLVVLYSFAYYRLKKKDL